MTESLSMISATWLKATSKTVSSWGADFEFRNLMAMSACSWASMFTCKGESSRMYFEKMGPIAEDLLWRFMSMTSSRNSRFSSQNSDAVKSWNASSCSRDEKMRPKPEGKFATSMANVKGGKLKHERKREKKVTRHKAQGEVTEAKKKQKRKQKQRKRKKGEGVCEHWSKEKEEGKQEVRMERRKLLVVVERGGIENV